jgi:hypothetical protein
MESKGTTTRDRVANMIVITHKTDANGVKEMDGGNTSLSHTYTLTHIHSLCICVSFFQG